MSAQATISRIPKLPKRSHSESSIAPLRVGERLAHQGLVPPFSNRRTTPGTNLAASLDTFLVYLGFKLKRMIAGLALVDGEPKHAEVVGVIPGHWVHPRYRWQRLPSMMESCITDHVWDLAELLT